MNPPPPPSTKPKKITFGKVQGSKHGHRVLLYGPGGIGKTTLACQAAGKVAFADADESLEKLKTQLDEAPLLIPCTDWTSLRSALQSDGYESIKTIVLDTATKIEEWCVAHTLKTVPNEAGNYVKKIEDYGYGKGYQYVFDTFLSLLGDLDRHVRAGRNVILIAHDCIKTVPNPEGTDWIRYEPRMQDPPSGKGSIRLKVKEWSDHTLFYAYDVAVNKEDKRDKKGKGKGSGTRTIYTSELPHFMAKSRTTADSILVDGKTDVWKEIIK